jgi:nitroreductase
MPMNISFAVIILIRILTIDTGVTLDFLELAAKRQSVRGYLDKPVEREQIERCLQAARLAPSACNSQPWKFIVIDDEELKNKIASTTCSNLISINRFSAQAPVLVLVLSEKQKLSAKFGSIVKNRQLKMIDIGIAAEHFCLQAAEEGIGTCMMGWFAERKVNKLLQIPKGKRVELVISVGYPSSEKIRKKNRKTIDEIRSFNKY